MYIDKIKNLCYITHEEPSTITLLGRGRTASQWRKKNPAPAKDEDIICSHMKVWGACESGRINVANLYEHKIKWR